MRYSYVVERSWRSVMRKAWLVPAVTAASLAALWVGATSASASVAGIISPTATIAHNASEITKVNHWRRYYGWGGYYPNYYYAAPYAYAYPPVAYYPPPVTYYAVPAPRYVPYYPYDGYYVRHYRSRYYYGW
jgi:hypothetical protein